ncbi:MAG: helix-turn-helix domain-containing protein [Fibrobacteres bacterium]|nr:helix-turn-helix domain-containing protein [Fibrobacterota bacterium]
MTSEPLVGIFVKYCNSRKNIKAYHIQAKMDEGKNLFAMMFVSAGAMAVTIDSDQFVVSPGEAVFLSPGIKYQYQPEKGKTPVTIYLLHFTPVSPTGPFSSISEFGLPLHGRSTNTSATIEAFTELENLFYNKGKKNTVSVPQKASIAAMKLFLTFEMRTAVKTVENKAELPAEGRIWNVINYLRANYKKTPSLKELAELACMSPTYFKRTFLKVTGLTPHRYILEYKIERAKDFLLIHEESLSTTALELGFHDYAHFFKVFKNVTGKTPKEFLKDKSA